MSVSSESPIDGGRRRGGCAAVAPGGDGIGHRWSSRSEQDVERSGCAEVRVGRWVGRRRRMTGLPPERALASAVGGRCRRRGRRGRRPGGRPRSSARARARASSRRGAGGWPASSAWTRMLTTPSSRVTSSRRRPRSTGSSSMVSSWVPSPPAIQRRDVLDDLGGDGRRWPGWRPVAAVVAWRAATGAEAVAGGGRAVAGASTAAARAGRRRCVAPSAVSTTGSAWRPSPPSASTAVVGAWGLRVPVSSASAWWRHRSRRTRGSVVLVGGGMPVVAGASRCGRSWTESARRVDGLGLSAAGGDVAAARALGLACPVVAGLDGDPARSGAPVAFGCGRPDVAARGVWWSAGRRPGSWLPRRTSCRRVARAAGVPAPDGPTGPAERRFAGSRRRGRRGCRGRSATGCAPTSSAPGRSPTATASTSVVGRRAPRGRLAGRGSTRTGGRRASSVELEPSRRRRGDRCRFARPADGSRTGIGRSPQRPRASTRRCTTAVAPGGRRRRLAAIVRVRVPRGASRRPGGHRPASWANAPRRRLRRPQAGVAGSDAGRDGRLEGRDHRRSSWTLARTLRHVGLGLGVGRDAAVAGTAPRPAL